MAKSKKTHSGTHTNNLLNPCSIIGSALFTLNLVCKATRAKFPGKTREEVEVIMMMAHKSVKL
jgi:hypothetical protein